jgi:hypothetical protein
MKQVFLTLIFFITTLGYSQETQTTTQVPQSVETLEEVLTPYVKKLLNAAEQGVEFIADETPLVVQQYLLFEASISWLWVFLGILFITFIKSWLSKQFLVKSDEKPQTSKGYHEFFNMGNNMWLKRDTDSADYSVVEIWYSISKYSSILIGFIIILCNITTAIKVTFFPKLFLVEKFITLVS